MRTRAFGEAIFLLRTGPFSVTTGANMFSLQKLLGKEDKFFALLEASAEEARRSVQTLARLNTSVANSISPDEFEYPRLKDKQITQEISAAVYSTFITALEREDIEALSSALYKIPKTAQKFSERLLMAPDLVNGADFSPQINLIIKAVEIVFELVKCLRRMDLDKVKELNDKLQFIEGQADKQILKHYLELIHSSRAPLQVILLKDLYELLEKIVDRCRDCGNVIAHIALSNA
jgi:uncharacterized protein Yka (UPF0111/DUF47 family)